MSVPRSSQHQSAFFGKSFNFHTEPRLWVVHEWAISKTPTPTVLAPKYILIFFSPIYTPDIPCGVCSLVNRETLLELRRKLRSDALPATTIDFFWDSNPQLAALKLCALTIKPWPVPADPRQRTRARRTRARRTLTFLLLCSGQHPPHAEDPSRLIWLLKWTQYVWITLSQILCV